MELQQLAVAVNWNRNTNNQRECLNAMVELYQAVSGHNAHKLIELDAKLCQPVGIAFTSMALLFNNGDIDINSVAAENAFYCLARCHIETGNTYCLPAVFTLLGNKQKLLDSKLISSWIDLAQKEVGMPIGMMLGGNPYTDPRLSDFRNQAIGFAEQIRYYVLSKFYDIKNMQFIIPTDLRGFLPSNSEVVSFIKGVNFESNNSPEDYIRNGEVHFTSLYEQCRETLSRF